MKILITGVTGFLGSNLAKKFLLQGFDVIGIKRQTSSTGRIKELLANSQFNLINANEMDQVIKNHVDVIVHTATNYGRSGQLFQELEAVNTDFPYDLFLLAQQNNVLAFINADTFMSKETPKEDRYYNYVVTKKAFLNKAKENLRLGKTRLINMVVYHMFGPNDNAEKFFAILIKRMLANEPSIQLTSGTQKRDFIYIDDVVNAFYKVVLNLQKLDKFEEFNIGTGQDHSIKESIAYLHAVLKSQSILQWGALENKQHDEFYGATDISKNLKIDWRSEIEFKKALELTANYYLQNKV